MTHQHLTNQPRSPTICHLLFLLWSLWIYSNDVTAKYNYSIQPWPLSQHLNQQTILTVLHAKDGTLWIATLAGIDHFDGANFTQYRPGNIAEGHLPSSRIVTILEGDDETIYVVTSDAGLLLFNEKVRRFISVKWPSSSQLPTAKASSAISDGNDGIWIGYESGQIAFFSSSSRRLEIFSTNKNTRISSLARVHRGEIYAATTAGDLFKVESGRKGIKKIQIDKSCLNSFSALDAIADFSVDKLWLGTRGRGLLLLELDSGLCSPPDFQGNLRKSIDKADIREIFFDSYRDLTWVATDQGLYQIDSDLNAVHFGTGDSNISDNEVSSIAHGNSNFLWIGTYTGLNYLVPTMFEIHGDGSEKNMHSIVAIDGIEKSEPWIASYNGLFIYDAISSTHLNLSQIRPESNLLNKKIMALEINEVGIWVGYRASGLEFLPSNSSNHLSSWNTDLDLSLSSDSVSSILYTREGHILVGTYGGGLNIVSTTQPSDFYSIGNDRVIELYQTSDGTIWVGTESGLFTFDMTQRTASKVSFGNLGDLNAPEPIVWDVKESASGVLWLATMHHGVFTLDRSGASNKLDSDSLSSRPEHIALLGSVYALEIDDEGYIWCSTDSGLTRIDPVSKQTLMFSQQQGLQLSEFDVGVSHNDNNGHLYYGGNEGYIRFSPKEAGLAEVVPHLVFTKIAIGKSIFQEKMYLNSVTGIQLTHKDYFIQFNFSVLDFLDPEKNQYRYMLEGFDQNWIENGTRNTATYTSLPPGEYTLRVQGASSAGVWNREGLSLEIEVLPPPWLSWWAITFYVLLTGALVWMGKRAYDSYAIEHRAKEMAIQMLESDQRADDEMQEQLEIHDDLVKSVYRHSVATLGLVSEIVAIKASKLQTKDADVAVEGSLNLVQALILLEECLYYQNEILLADLHKYTNLIFSKLLQRAPVSPESITTINEVCKQAIPIEQASALAIALYELLDNSIQYAFADPSDANYLHVTLHSAQSASEGSHFHLTVQDSGPGIPSNIYPRDGEKSGLAIVMAMTQRLGGTLAFSSSGSSYITLTFPRDPPK